MLIYYLLAQFAFHLNAVLGDILKPCGRVIPESPLVRLNSNFTAYCVLDEKCMPLDSRKLIWKIRNKTVPENQYTIINATVSSVTIIPTSTSDDQLTCNALVHEDIKTTLHGIFLKLAYPPDKPDNLTCISYNAENLTCSWDPGKPTLLPTNYTLKRKWRYSTEIKDCIPKDVNNSCTVDWPNFQLYVDTLFWVEAANDLETVTSDILEWDIANIVKPNPPEIKQLVTTVGLPKAIKIEWKNPMEDNPNMQMKYIIRYRTNSSQEWEEVPQSDTASHRSSFTLQDLLPYTVYVVTMRCMQRSGQGFWSEWSKGKYTTTPEDKPNKRLSLWRKLGDPNEFGNRSVTLIWKVLEPQNANGKILNYTVTILKRPSEPFIIDIVNVTHYEAAISKDFFVATVIANNSMGASPPSHLAIPSAKNSKAQTAEIKIEVKPDPSNKTLLVEWKSQIKAVDGYVIEWCVNSESTTCEMKWQREPSTSSKAYLRGDFEPFKCYLIKVFPLYNDGRVSYVSAEAYLEEGAPSEGPSVRTKDVEKHSAILVWSPVPLDKRNGFIKYYTLTYASIQGNETTLKINQTDSEFTLSQLEGDTLYSVRMTAYTEGGQKDGAVFTFTTLRFANGEIEAIVVTSCIIFLVFVLAGAITCFSKRDLIKKHIWPNVPDPSKSNIAKWSPQTPSRHEFNPKNSLFQDGSFTDVSVVEVSEEKNSYNEQDIKPMDPLKKNTSEGLSSGIGGSSCMSSPQLSVSDGDGVESAQTTSSTVQYSSVIISGYRDQQPTTVIPHVFSRSESTQPLLESEERPDDQQPVEGEDHPVVASQYFKQNCSPEEVTGRLETSVIDGGRLENGFQEVIKCPEEQSADSQVDHVIGGLKSYLPQIVRRGGYMPQ
ncbi:interleukin-6 receptor subunit beta isoform X1 [Pelobates cultripes]|uniref:Interleukin-6 receptor subunit beta isoform X1 n=1 Tax=Pelobates cultripes TaxID=61616 RepID=A0AAD1SE00_PELCU|nr:interleukin-6 receptor subunit beta isoform X1 [Pelobates cultripes]